MGLCLSFGAAFETTVNTGAFQEQVLERKTIEEAIVERVRVLSLETYFHLLGVIFARFLSNKVSESVVEGGECSVAFGTYPVRSILGP